MGGKGGGKGGGKDNRKDNRKDGGKDNRQNKSGKPAANGHGKPGAGKPAANGHGGHGYHAGGPPPRPFSDFQPRSRVTTTADIEKEVEPVFGDDVSRKKFLTGLPKQSRTLVLLQEHGSLVDCAKGWREMARLLSGDADYDEVEPNMDEELWAAIEGMGYEVRGRRCGRRLRSAR